MKAFVTFLCAALLAGAAHAQAWPDKQVTLVVPFPPGGSTDQVARAVGPRLTEKFKQSFVVDNRAGATGTIGATYVKRAPADGSTFLVTSLGPLVIVPHLLKGMQYDALKDFDLITVAVQSSNVLVVPANSPHKNVADVIAWQKANPGKMTFGSSGAGSSDHLTAELFWQETNTKGIHVPYKGGAPAMTDLLGGQVSMSFMTALSALPHLQGGKLNVIGVAAPKRMTQLPNVPTIEEGGVPDFEVSSWNGLFAPGKTPQPIIDRLYEVTIAALKSPQMKEKMEAEGAEPVGQTPAQFRAYVQAEIEKWSKVIKAANVRFD